MTTPGGGRAKALPRHVSNEVPSGGYPAWSFPEPAEAPEPTPCKIGQANAIALAPRGQPARSLSLQALFQGSLAQPMEGGRHAGEPAVAVGALLENVDEQYAVSVWSCDGEQLTLPPGTLRQTPNRWMLVQSRHGNLKLLDREAPDGDRRPVLRAPTRWEWTPAAERGSTSARQSP